MAEPTPGAFLDVLHGRGGVETGDLATVLARPGSLRTVNAPVVNLRTGQCAGFAAQVRIDGWSGLGPTGPEQAAAEAGLTGELVARFLEVALRARQTMPGERFLLLELPAGALAHDPVRRLLTDEDDVANLVLTLAEGAAREPAAQVQQLRARGALLAVRVGDGGLGDLLAVERLRPDAVRLPVSLVRAVTGSSAARQLLACLAGLTADVGAQLLAEDVESLEEVWALRSAGVRYGQGWLFGRARPGFAPPPADVCAVLATAALPNARSSTGPSRSRAEAGA